MTKIITSVHIDAPIERVFDLSRSIEFHCYSQSHREEIPIDGTITGLINLGERVTWEARHFFIRQKLSVEITKFERPYHFRDTMTNGAFKKFEHDHILEQVNGRVKLTDVFEYETPFSIFGKVFDLLVLKKYMTNFCSERNNALKKALETEAWKKFLEH